MLFTDWLLYHQYDSGARKACLGPWRGVNTSSIAQKPVAVVVMGVGARKKRRVRGRERQRGKLQSNTQNQNERQEVAGS